MTKRQLKTWLSRISLFIIMCAFMGGAVSCNSPDSNISPEELGLIAVDVEAPDFTLPTTTGTEITLSDLQGMPVVLNFWAIRCPPCRVELPYLDAVAKQNADEVTIIAVNIEDSISKIKKFFGENKVSFIVAIDENAQETSGYATGYIPTTVFVDSRGVVRYLKVGAFTDEEPLQACITRIKEES